jgi:hypothetical protein
MLSTPSTEHDEWLAAGDQAITAAGHLTFHLAIAEIKTK